MAKGCVRGPYACPCHCVAPACLVALYRWRSLGGTPCSTASQQRSTLLTRPAAACRHPCPSRDGPNNGAPPAIKQNHTSNQTKSRQPLSPPFPLWSGHIKAGQHSEVGIHAELVQLAGEAGHDAALLVVAHALLKEVGLATASRRGEMGGRGHVQAVVSEIPRWILCAWLR